jgi:hypothetical protein
MPLAATVKSQMLRFLRRNKNTRAARCESPARSSRKKGGGDTAMVIPNKRVSVLVDSQSAHNNGMVTVAEPYAMALGAAVAVKAASSGSKHETTKKQASSTTQRAKEGGHRSSSQARRHKTQVMEYSVSGPGFIRYMLLTVLVAPLNTCGSISESLVPTSFYFLVLGETQVCFVLQPLIGLYAPT